MTGGIGKTGDRRGACGEADHAQATTRHFSPPATHAQVTTREFMVTGCGIRLLPTDFGSYPHDFNVLSYVAYIIVGIGYRGVSFGL